MGATEGPTLLPAASKADKAAGGAIHRALSVSRFTGKSAQVLEVLAPAGVKATRIPKGARSRPTQPFSE